MKKTIISYLLASMLIFSCCQSNSSDYYNINSVNLKKLKADTIFTTNNIFIPFELHMYRQWMVGITSLEKFSNYPVVFYDTSSFRVDFSIGKFGRGPGEYTGIDPYFFEKTDRGVTFYTDFFFEESFILPLADDRAPEYRIRLLESIVNKLNKLNDTLYVYINPKLRESLFILYDAKNQREIKKFGELPEVNVPIEGEDHLQNLYSCFVKVSDDKGTIAAIFTDIPVFQIYRNFELKTEIYIDRKSDCPTRDALFNRKCPIYYSQPYITKNHIWMKYVNSLPGTETGVTELHSWSWDGKFTGRYELDSESIDFTVSDNEHSIFLFTLKSEFNEIRKYSLIDKEMKN